MPYEEDTPRPMKENLLNLETIHECNCCLGNKTLNPLVSVIDLSQACLEQCILKFDFYTVIMLEGEVEDFLYGRKYYDYSNASLLFLTPGESLKVDYSELFYKKGWLLAFHPELLLFTPLMEQIKNYRFFSYAPDEALHLSLREKQKVTDCLHGIEDELEHATDCHSQGLITKYIELLLDYCTRFYERQFITRCEANKALIRQTNVLLDEYIQSGRLKTKGMPSEGYCAGQLQLSTQYFIDLLYFETGQNIYEYFEFKRLEAAKEMLLEEGATPASVAQRLGYRDTLQFSRLFGKVVGIRPCDYRIAQN
jgi:AraC-like DNA-binding protein